jgi:predicted patatin/cPLA2 family phospholipase
LSLAKSLAERAILGMHFIFGINRSSHFGTVAFFLKNKTTRQRQHTQKACKKYAFFHFFHYLKYIRKDNTFEIKAIYDLTPVTNTKN